MRPHPAAVLFAAALATLTWRSARAQGLPESARAQQPYAPQLNSPYGQQLPQPYPAQQPSSPYPAPQPQPYASQPYAPQPYPAPQPYAPQPYPAPQQQPYPYPTPQPYPAPQPNTPQPGMAPSDAAWPPSSVSGPGVVPAPARTRRRRRRAAPPPDEPSDQRAVSLTVSLLHPLLVSVFDAALEVRLGRNVGLAAVGGFGSIGLRQLDKRLPDQSAHLLELGGQLRTYPAGTFDHGMQLGFEIMYLHGSADASGTIQVPELGGMTYSGSFTAQGRGFKLGPFIGYKLTLPVGLTFNAQLGVEYFSISAEASDSLGHTETGSNRGALPLVDASLGWSF